MIPQRLNNSNVFVCDGFKSTEIEKKKKNCFSKLVGSIAHITTKSTKFKRGKIGDRYFS